MTLTQTQWILTIFGMAAAVLILIVACFAIRRMYLMKKGRYVRKRAYRILRRYAGVRNFKVLRDVTVSIQGRTAHTDLMLIGFFGIIFFETEDYAGEYYGNPKDETWAYVSPNQRKTRIPNGLTKLEKDIDVYRTIFASNNVYKIQMEPMIIFSPFKKKTEIYVHETVPFLRVNELRGHLDKVKYDKDNDVDVPLLVSLIQKYQKN